MTVHPNLTSHDATWAPGGRASDVPISGRRENPFERTAAETGDRPAPFEIVCFTKTGGPLTKRISLNEDGSTKSDGSGCLMPRGTAVRTPIDGIAELAALISGLRPDQAISLGALRADLPDQVSVVTKDKLKQFNGHGMADAIARTADSIQFRTGKPGFVLFDYDTKGMPVEVEARLKERGKYWTALCEVLPGLRGASYMQRRSTSAGLLRADTGGRLPGSKGLHVYVAVKDSADIERFLKTVHDRCWLGGFGWLMVGAGGQLLDRSIVDRMVGAPERLVFEGAPVLVPPLTQNEEERRPHVFEGVVIDTLEICPPLSLREIAELNKLRAIAEQRLAPAAAQARETFVEEQTERLIKRTGMSKREATRVVECQIGGTLLPDLELQFDDDALAGTTVADVLKDPTKFVGETLADPLEGVGYGTCKAKIMRKADGSLWINSFAHGRTTYDLKLDVRAIRAALDNASKDEVVGKFIDLALQADLDAVELEQLLGLASERSGLGHRVIARTLKGARTKAAASNAEQERKRRQAERADPRPAVPAPAIDAPWLPQMQLLDDVLGTLNAAEPPMRNHEGMLTQCRMRTPVAMHAFGSTAANGEDTEGEDTKLPPPKQHLLTVLSEPESAELIERHIDFIDGTDRSVHLASPFVRHYMQRTGGALPIAGAIATLPLVLADGDVLAEPGLDRERGIVFRLEPGIVALMPRSEDCDKDHVVDAMQFLCEEWLVDVATTYAGKCILIAAAMTIIERSLFPERPAFWVTAGRRGGGKTTALTMLIMATLGLRPAAATWTPNEEERRKALLSYLMDGVPYILWDNVPRGITISCPHIERCCTADTYVDRKLGVSERVQASAATIHLFTGNNIAPKGDLASRSLQVRIEVDRTDPENRPFRHGDPVGWTEANRVKILRALYKILLGNPELKKSKSAPAKTRFKLWWRVVGAAIENAAKLHYEAIDPAAYDVKDRSRPLPIDFQQLFLEQESDEEDSASLADSLGVLNKRWPGGTFKAADVAALINENGNTPDGIVIREFLFPGQKNDVVSSKAVGRRLIAHVGNPVRHDDKILSLYAGEDNRNKMKTFLVNVTTAEGMAA
ncbi:hypothetical protein [Bradyrhizobium erythrophlei]|uniref:Uncharacterized protein n=1 Tax=Bradyrhizobium erythrophlei TaxID=1437360 RepID=A0A1M7T784_9BRAD|nr:hypothetical protein [Bradyrhizobium erythrophlei]SHN66588.1 hypothetical protein SAMN05444170_1002 [Bradyrhizobium erythrophlei]